MAKRALLIGSQTGGLQGTTNDVRTMSGLLESRGFATESLLDGDASRDGILAAYARLIADSKPDDAALVFYSGHGGRAANPHYDPEDHTAGPQFYQIIIPTDFEDSSPTDFRGITSHELSAWMSRLTDQTKNVTVILDCCHSALMSRAPNHFRPKARSEPCFVGIAEHLEHLRAEGIDVSGVPRGNPHAVGVVACGPSQSAYEYPADGNVVGILTESLRIAFEEAEALESVDWQAMGVRIRNRILSVFPAQRPLIEGPASRVVFELREVDRRGVLPVVLRDGRPMLEGGRILGVGVGDGFAIMPMGATAVDPARRLAEATVTRVGGATASIAVQRDTAARDLKTGDLAFPVSVAYSRGVVEVAADDPASGEALSAVIEADQFLDVAAPETPSEHVAVAVVADGRIELRDSTGVPLFAAKDNHAAGIAATVANLRVLAQAHAMRTLTGGVGPAALGAEVEIEWGVVDGETECPLPASGAVFHAGERLFLRLRNPTGRTLWVSVFDVGIAGTRTLLNEYVAPEGVELAPNGGEWVFGLDETGVLTGEELSWPDGVPKSEPRLESEVVIVTDRPHDLRSLGGAGMRAAVQARSPLQDLLDQVVSGRTRELGAQQVAADIRYDVHRIDFFVDPVESVGRSAGAFLIDETPDASVLARSTRAMVGKPPTKVGVSLTDLIVHRNRAFGSATVRVDTMVISKVAAGREPRLWQQTIRFPRIRDGESLPFGREAIYVGDVEDFLTLGVWVSRDVAESQDLARMFEAQLASERCRTALTTIAALSVAAPQAAIAAAAVGAGATLLSIGYQLLSQALPKSIGLYRNSFLRSDRFGIGRHPEAGLLTAQDFSCAYVVTDESDQEQP